MFILLSGDQITSFSAQISRGVASKNLQTQRDIQSWLGRAEKDERVIFGPMRLSESDQEQPSPTEMGILTAVRDDNDAILAIILVTRIGMHQEFSRMFFDIANAGNLDAYAVDETGTMLTESPRAADTRIIKTT